MAKQYLNFIAGKWCKAGNGTVFENINPADSRDVIGSFPDSGVEDIDRAVKAARAAFDGWRLVPPPKRAQILMEASKHLERGKRQLAELMTREMGKIVTETEGDVQEAIDMAFLMAGEGRRWLGETMPSELRNKFCMTVRRPVGVCGLITPWNFPMAVPSWKLLPALLCGNTVVWKPAEDTPASAVKFVEILEKAGVPKGVVNLVHGGPAAGEALVQHKLVDLISFTGSCEVGREVAGICGRTLKRCSLELGGKNAQIVMGDADLDLALEGALWGAFGTTGQRCTATSRIYVQKKLFNAFRKKLVARARRIRIGNGLQSKVQMGPLINEAQRERVHHYVQIGIEEGAKLECGGKDASGAGLSRGWFYQPTVFTGTNPKMRIIREEIFGPVVCLVPFTTFEDALEKVNAVEYGLSSAIYTRDVNLAMRAVRDIDAGITYVNGPTIGAEVQLPFGGVKNTGNGHREAGRQVLEIFSEWKSVYIDYSGKLQRAQIDNE